MTAIPEARETRAELIARRTRGLMAETRVRQVDVCQALGITQPSLSRRLNAIYPFSVDEIEVLAGLFGVEEPYLYGFTNDPGTPVRSTHRYVGNVTDLTPFIERRAQTASEVVEGLPGAPAKVFTIRRRVVIRHTEQAS